jgi:hypothetical protein
MYNDDLTSPTDTTKEREREREREKGNGTEFQGRRPDGMGGTRDACKPAAARRSHCDPFSFLFSLLVLGPFGDV